MSSAVDKQVATLAVQDVPHQRNGCCRRPLTRLYAVTTPQTSHVDGLLVRSSFSSEPFVYRSWSAGFHNDQLIFIPNSCPTRSCKRLPCVWTRDTPEEFLLGNFALFSSSVSYSRADAEQPRCSTPRAPRTGSSTPSTCVWTA